MKLWLDDIRPAPPGWVHVRTDLEAREYLKRGDVEQASLDHDLGACQVCRGDDSDEAWLARTGFQSMPNCEHFGTGYTLVCWMEETGYWPLVKPLVHSANPVGRAKMLTAIERHFSALAKPATAGTANSNADSNSQSK